MLFPNTRNILMLIKNSQQNILLDLPSNVNNVGLRLSGGTDSAIVGYILSKYIIEERPDIKIVPITIVQVGKAYQLIFAKRIVEFYKKEFGDIFLDHYSAVSNDKTQYSLSQTALQKSLYKKNIINFHFTGITLNPPAGVIPESTHSPGWTEPEDRIRTGNLKPTYDKNRCSPLVNIDKKGVAELYHTLGVINTLFPLTRSCEKQTEDFSKHCEQCWFCAERFYGFGRYV